MAPQRHPFCPEGKGESSRKSVQVRFHDQPRFGQQGTLKTVRAEKGSLPPRRTAQDVTRQKTRDYWNQQEFACFLLDGRVHGILHSGIDRLLETGLRLRIVYFLLAYATGRG